MSVLCALLNSSACHEFVVCYDDNLIFTGRKATLDCWPTHRQREVRQKWCDSSTTDEGPLNSVLKHLVSNFYVLVKLLKSSQPVS